MPVSLGNNRANVTWGQSCQFHLGTIVAVSFGNNRGSVTWVQLCQFHLGAILPVQFGKDFSFDKGNGE